MEFTSNTDKLNILKDPFIKNKLKAIHMHSYPKYNSTEWVASIEFANGLTEGTQKFTGKDFQDITLQMKSFIESLE